MSLRLREDEATAAAEACAALAEEMTNTCADPKLRGCSCTCDPLSAREPETDPPPPEARRGQRGLTSICAIHSHFLTLPPLHPLLIAHSHITQRLRGAQLGSDRLGSAQPWSVRPSSLSHWDLNLKKKKKKHLKELHHSQRCHMKCRGKRGFGSSTSCAGFDHPALMGVDVVRRQHRDRRISKLEFNGRKCVIAL